MEKEYPLSYTIVNKKKSENADPHITHMDWLQYYRTITLIIHLGTPSLNSFEKSFVWFTLSKALDASWKAT